MKIYSDVNVPENIDVSKVVIVVEDNVVDPTPGVLYICGRFVVFCEPDDEVQDD